MMYKPGERPTDISVVESIIKNAVEGENLILVAEEDENIIGFLSALRSSQKRIHHSAYIIIGIREAYRNLGIGKELFSNLNIWAKENNITRLELTVISTNEPARKLYEKNGFEIEGIRKNSMIIDGAYVDELYMAKLL
ncbi:hypothetical protein SDC9_166186 [bioreactor metagenome]|uniref:N-acetyltransferase domain-containing protein n=1 Tax=bioreactor metagenome TaxID=1076179 RepID=A0A645FWA5_9ZZZZ